MREDLSAFFKRRLSQLQVKKVRLITRWAFHSRLSVPELEKQGALLDKALGRLQKEMDLTINRVERLQLEDGYLPPEEASKVRPVPMAKDEINPDKQKPLY